MQQDIKDLISNETILKVFLLKFENKKIIIEHFSTQISDFIAIEDQHNVFYYGNFSYLQGITFENETFDFFPVAFNAIISGASTSWYLGPVPVNFQCLKITII
jgi:hypothetical protein